MALSRDPIAWFALKQFEHYVWENCTVESDKCSHCRPLGPPVLTGRQPAVGSFAQSGPFALRSDGLLVKNDERRLETPQAQP